MERHESPDMSLFKLFYERQHTQQNSCSRNFPSMFDTQMVGAVKNSMLPYTRDSKRGRRNKDAYCMGVMQQVSIL